MGARDRYDVGFQDGAREERRRLIERLRRDAARRGPSVRPILSELASVLEGEGEGPITMTECPVRDCIGGQIVRRAPESMGGGYSVIQPNCTYCNGAGAVSPTRSAAYTGPRK
jgi:hypothetical protein